VQTDVLTSFIHALRNADVRVSPAETLDALAAADLVGYSERTRLKNALALTLPKTLEEKAIFDVCFDQFFAPRDGSPVPDAPGGDASPDNPQAQATSAPESALGELLGRGNAGEIGAAINSAGGQVKVHEIDVFTQKGVYTRRILEAMGYVELQQEIVGLEGGSDVAQRQRARNLARRRDWLREQVRNYVERQFLLHADVSGRRLREDLLRNVRLAGLDRRHQHALEQIVRRMARRFVAAYSQRRRVFRRGQLHVPRTIRRNLKYDDAIFDLHWNTARASRPKLFAVCDVSGSVASYAQFMLMLLYSLSEVLPKVRSFAFSSDLGEVSALFEGHGIESAIALALKLHGGGSTDYGRALTTLRQLCIDELDKRTTLIVLGDARNNQGDSRIDLMKELYERCRRVIWLNPEPRSMWNTGDSDMRHFAVYCHQVEECGTIAQLERFASRLLRTPA
jgi:uncharacterized protein with von Willebrand factor type A (vWA) domain